MNVFPRFGVADWLVSEFGSLLLASVTCNEEVHCSVILGVRETKSWVDKSAEVKRNF